MDAELTETFDRIICDPETNIISGIFLLLSELKDDEARQRVIVYLCWRFGFTVTVDIGE